MDVTEMSPTLLNFIHAVPKIELHVHIEGTLTPQLRFRLAKKHGMPLKWNSEEEMLEEYVSYFQRHLHAKERERMAFFNLYFPSLDVLKDEEDFYLLAMGYFERAVEQNVRYAEAFVSATTHWLRGVSVETVLKGLKRADEEAKKRWGDKFVCKWILTFLRTESAESAMELYQSALDHRDMIIGIGLGGNERGRSAMIFDEVYKKAKADGFHLTAHCDVEIPDIHEHIYECATQLGGDGIGRLDHGLNAAERPELLQLVKEKRIGLTAGPWGSYGYSFGADDGDRLFLGMIKKLFDEGCLVTVNSDDPGFMGMNYVEENLQLVAHKCGLGIEEVARLEENAVEVCWAPAEYKEKLYEEIRMVLAAAKS